MKNPIPAPSVNDNATNGQNRFQCPNCWGFQQWNDQYTASAVVIPNTPKVTSQRDSFVRKFMVKYTQNIR